MDGVGAGGIDQLGFGLVGGQGIGAGGGDGNDVRLLARFQRPNLLIKTQSGGAAACGQPQRGAGGDLGGVERVHFVELGRRRHLPEHVEVVVAGRAIRSQPDGQPGGQHLRDGRDAAAQFHIAFRAVHHAHLMFGQQADFFFVQPDAMRGDNLAI